MFTSYFQMHSEPFKEQMPLEGILTDERFTQGLARLEYFLEQGSMALLIGQTGVGKSTLVKKFKDLAEQKQNHLIYIYLTHVNAPSLLSQIVSELGEKPKRGKDRLFQQIRQKIAKETRTTCLVIDEAHLLNDEALIDLRLLISSALDEKPLLKILLCAQESLIKTLKQESLADLKNRIAVKIRLLKFSREQTSAYIDHQMKTAGAPEKTFDQEAKDAIHDLTDGVPREVNSIARACLLTAIDQNLKRINVDLLKTAAQETLF